MTESNSPQPAQDTPDSETEIQAALAAPFEVRLSQRAGRFVACIPELGLLASAKTVDAAHADIVRQRETRIREYASEGLLHSLPKPGPLAAEPNGPTLLGQLKVFLIKAAVVAALFLGAVNIIGNGLGNIGYVLEKKLAGTATMTPESVEKHRAQAARIAANLGPILREITAMFQTPAPSAPTDPAKP